MSVRLTSQENRVALFDSVSGFAFGPVFEDERDAEHFLTYVQAHTSGDARSVTQQTYAYLYDEWRTERGQI